MSCPGAAFYLSLHFLSSAPLLCNAQGSFCRDYPVRYVFLYRIHRPYRDASVSVSCSFLLIPEIKKIAVSIIYA